MEHQASHAKKVNKEHERPTPTACRELPSGELVELVYRPDEGRTLLLVWDGSGWREERSITLPTGERIVPYSARNNLLVHDVVLLPSEPLEYASDQQLVAEVRDFIHRYVDISPSFEEVASYYVLFSWIYDSFNELPYLRVRGDFGSGKSRFLLTVGSLCYKPIFASGASTVSPIFRIIDAFRGTLVIDEGDFRLSDEKAEVIKILNNGNARGFPVLRSEQLPSGEFNPTAYCVFGPKLIATRGYFEDRALESRCITEELGGRRLRTDIPINLPDSFKDEALSLRNKLLLYRFRNWKQMRSPATLTQGLEPRVAQVFNPLLSVVDEPEARERLEAVALGHSGDVTQERSTTIEAGVLEVLRELRQQGGLLSVKAIAGLYAERFGEDLGRPVTPHWIGSVLRRKLFLKTQKSNGNFVIADSEHQKLTLLFERYGFEVGEETSGTLGI